MFQIGSNLKVTDISVLKRSYQSHPKRRRQGISGQRFFSGSLPTRVSRVVSNEKHEIYIMLMYIVASIYMVRIQQCYRLSSRLIAVDILTGLVPPIYSAWIPSSSCIALSLPANPPPVRTARLPQRVAWRTAARRWTTLPLVSVQQG